MTFEDPREHSGMDVTLSGWQELLVQLVDLQREMVTVTVTEQGLRVAELRGELHSANTGQNGALLIWVGRRTGAAAVGVCEEFLDGWNLFEDDGREELVLDHNGTRVSIDYSPGAGRP